VKGIDNAYCDRNLICTCRLVLDRDIESRS
jgi:hypothetical protein